MKKYLIICLSLCLMFFSVPQVVVAEWTGNVNFTLGAKALDDDDWEPVEDQTEFGIAVDFRQQEWPINIAIALLGSYAEEDWLGINVEGSTAELRLGVKKIWEPNDTMRPFIGGGLAIINAEVEGRTVGATVTADDSAAGLWVSGGIYWTLGNFNLGFELGASSAEVSWGGDDYEAGGGHAGILLGYHW